MKWVKYEENECYAIAINNYKSDDIRHMELRLGDFLCIREHYPNWFRGFKYTKPCELKVFPMTHVKILTNEIHPDLWAEMYSWIPNIRDAFIFNDNNDFDQINEAIHVALAEKRFDNTIDKSFRMTETNKRAVIQKMEVARKLLGLPIESRTEKGDKIDLKNVSVLDLYTQHQKDYDNNKKVSKQFDATIDNISLYLKLLRINFERSQVQDEMIDINISLYKVEDRNRISRVSETYSHRVAMRMSECDLIRVNAIIMKDIQFTPNQKLFLVFQFIRIGQMCLQKKIKKDELHYRRPKGVSVLEVTSAMIENHDSERQVGIQILQKDEYLENVTEQLIHDYRINRREYRNVINIQLKAIRPEEINDRSIILLGMNPYYPPPIRNQRNCLYLTLHHAEIDREKKKSDPNFEVEISVHDSFGKKVVLPTVEWRQLVEYHSVVYYHFARPRWCEVICIPLFDKLEQFGSFTHIRFVIWHRSLNERNKNPRGVAYLKLFPKDSNAILCNKDHDNFHILAIHKMEMDKIKTAEYLKCSQEVEENFEIVSKGNPNATFSRVGGNKKKLGNRDTLFVQTLLCSTEYTFDELLANVCCDAKIDQTIMHQLNNQEIIVKNIDVNEMKKFATKILESSLDLIQRATDETYLGGNILTLLGEMFKAIKNLPDYQAQIDKFINDTMHFNVHKQILRELINHVPETDSNTLRASDWFMKIVVKSFQNFESGQAGNIDEETIFNDLVDQYLQKLESLALKKENRILRSIVLSKAGPIINALIPVCQPIGMAKLVNNLLKCCSDLDAITKAGLTMDCMTSKLFTDAQCRKIILPETTNNILELFNFQLGKIYQGRELDQDHLLDNICDKMIDFMQLHERSWQRSHEIVDNLVYELIIEHKMFRSCVSIISGGLEFIFRDESNSKLLHRPLMVLVSVVITCLSYLSDRLWDIIIREQKDKCLFCGGERMTDNYDMISELLNLIYELQNNPVFPSNHRSRKSDSHMTNIRLSKSFSAPFQVVPRSSKLMKQAWMNMLFVQSRQFLSTLKQIHNIILKPYYLKNLIQNIRTKQNRICCCHPSEKLQYDLINSSVDCISSIITQPFLNLEKLPSSAVLRLMQNSKEWGGDIRYWGALQIKMMWHDLGILKNRFSKTFFNIFAKLTTIQNYKIRILAVECLFDIVHLDPENKKTELITQIDQAMENADANYCEEMSKAFKQVLSSSNQYADDSQLVEHIIVQMNNIEECSHHLNDNSPINGMIVINNLREFYKNMGRSDIIGRYLFKLMTIHEKIKNYTEMGNTLLELSSFYKWNNELVQDTFLPPEYAECEFEWQLKAKLLEDSLKYFEKENWEEGIEVCKELVNGYTNFVVDFIKLGEAYSKMSELLKKIMFEDRADPSFYIIFYLGTGFPKFITELPEKSIVIRSKRNPDEMSIDLNSQFKFTTVEKKFPEESDKNCSDKKIFYMPVKPHKFEIPKKYEGKYVKQRILKYYENYFIGEFVYKRLLNTAEDAVKRKIDGSIIMCDEKLPNILSVVPVKSTTKVDIDPFIEALSDLESQCRKDEMLYQDFEAASADKRQIFYQKMKDVILRYISPVSGGLTKLVEMIPPQINETFSFACDVVTQVLSLIYQYLQAFEIYDNLENYNIFLSEFTKLVSTSSNALDIDSDEFNIHILPDQFIRSRKQNQTITTIRRPSQALRIRNEDESTLSRKAKFFENRPEMISERNSINLSEGREAQTSLLERDTSFSRTITNSNDLRNTSQNCPPLPPKPSRLTSSIGPTGEPPLKPRCDSGSSSNFQNNIFTHPF